MPKRSVIEFWFEFASTYSHLASHRIEAMAAAANVDIQWCPFLLGPILQAQGWKDSPFNLFPAKGNHMWRDMERESERLAVPFRKPTQFPRQSLLAARVATAAVSEPWIGRFVRTVFKANFSEDRDIADRVLIRRLLAECGCSDPETVMAHAASDEVKEQLKARTAAALDRGIFGAPTFFVGNEMFWGADRLPQALSLAEKLARQTDSLPN